MNEKVKQLWNDPGFTLKFNNQNFRPNGAHVNFIFI